METISVVWNEAVGTVKPMHCVNNAPLSGTSDALWDTLHKAAVPYARLHDTGGIYGGNRYVDVPNIFRDFSADPDDPASYDFAFTDWLLEKFRAQGVRPFYRLGVTIENDCRIRAYRIFPPADDLRWARVCEHIIRHYNEGWADGFHYGIEYWEIWNEPDNEEDPLTNPMWRGDMRRYFSLYEVVSNYLKEKFPHLKIGGYASCGFYAILGESVNADAHVSSRFDYFTRFFQAFLEHISSDAHKSPLDFFSWHSYSFIDSNLKYAAYVREMLDSYGFANTESILNEWNPGIAERGKLQDAANIAGMMCAMQNAPLDMLMYYDAQINSAYCGLYDPVAKTVFKAYYAFWYFGKLYRLGTQVKSGVSCSGLYAVAARGGEEGGILVSNLTGEAKSFRADVGAFRRADVYRISETGEAESSEKPERIALAQDTVLRILPGEVVYLNLH